MFMRDIIVIGTSAGGVSALQTLCAGLPGNLAASIFVVQHLSPTSKSVLPWLLSRAGELPAFHPIDGEPIRPGHIHVAPPDHHLLVKPGHVLIRRGPKENRTRPAVDPLFRSAAIAYGPRVIGVVLTGTLDDGSSGLIAVKRCGGISVVQDPDSAAWPDMPRNAIAHDHVDHCVNLTDLPALLVGLTGEPAGPTLPVPDDLVMEVRIAETETAIIKGIGAAVSERITSMTCPECGGALAEIQEDTLIRFRCRIGHAYSPAALADAQGEVAEQSMWKALRAYDERRLLFERLAENARSRQRLRAAALWDQAARDISEKRHQLQEEIIARTVPNAASDKAEAAEDAEAMEVAKTAGNANDP
jgi:two-component system chemotaxis response regulator CheB